MEFLNGAVVVGLWGCVISILLAAVIVLTVVFVVGGWDGGAFVRGMILMSIMIGVCFSGLGVGVRDHPSWSPGGADPGVCCRPLICLADGCFDC